MFITFRDNDDNVLHAINIEQVKDIYINGISLVFQYDIDTMVSIDCRNKKNVEKCWDYIIDHIESGTKVISLTKFLE